MREPITFAVVFIIAFTNASAGQPLSNAAAPNANSKRIELPAGSEAAKAMRVSASCPPMGFVNGCSRCGNRATRRASCW